MRESRTELESQARAWREAQLAIKPPTRTQKAVSDAKNGAPFVLGGAIGLASTVAAVGSAATGAYAIAVALGSVGLLAFSVLVGALKR